jgi:hypothetical protein
LFFHAGGECWEICGRVEEGEEGRRAEGLRRKG